VTDDLERAYDAARERFDRAPRRALLDVMPREADDARVTVVIATKNRPSDFARLLASIHRQPTQPHRILVIDQSDEPYAIDSGAGIVHVHDTAIRGLTLARNRAIDMLDDAPYVLFLDDDAEFANDVLARLATAFERYPDAVGLQCEVEQPETRETARTGGLGARLWRRWEDVFYRGFFDNRLGPLKPGSDRIDRVHGCAMAFRRELFEREAFDPLLVDYGYGEDWDFSRRAVRYGKLYLARGAHVIHHESTTNRYRQRRLLEQRWHNMLYFYDKYEAGRNPLDRLWRYWWMIGEALVWFKKGYGLPHPPAARSVESPRANPTHS
jgi:GT2 family glycosyltransferase